MNTVVNDILEQFIIFYDFLSLQGCDCLAVPVKDSQVNESLEI